MVRPAPAHHRWARGLVFGLLTVGLGVGAHVWAGGGAPSGAVAVVLASAVVASATTLTRRYRSFPTLLAALAACQVVLHGGLSLADHGMAAAMGPVGTTAHRHGADLMGGATGAMHGSPTMLLAHAAATLLAAAAMARGERLLAWLATASRWFVLALPPVLPALVRVVIVGAQAEGSVRDVVTRLPARGPPSLRPPVVAMPAARA